MSVDIAIVGGGVYGASTLYHLAARGIEAALFEQHQLATGPTGRSVANVRLHYTMPELAELARRSHECFHNFEERIGGDAGFVQIGIAYALGEEEAPLFEANARRLQALGFPIDLLSPSELGALVPSYNLEGVSLGMLEPTSGYADPVATTNVFASRARDLGASVNLNSRVTRVLVEHGKAIGLETEDGRRHAAGAVVLAVGPWTNRMLEPLGVQLRLTVERQAIAIIDAPAEARSLVPFVWADSAANFYARPEGPSTILIGDETATPPIGDPDTFNPVTSFEESIAFVAKAATRIPALSDLGVRAGYASLYDVSEDRLPIVDQVPGVEGLYVVCGTSGHGFKISPAMGAEIAELVVAGSSELLAPFVIDRVYDVDRERSR